MPDLDDAALDAIDNEHTPRAARDYRICDLCEALWPCPSSRLVAALRAEREEVARLRGIPEPDNHHNAYACPHCEAPIRAVEAERDAAVARADAAGAAIAAVRALCDPDSGMATNCWPGARHFDADDVTRALDTGATT